MKNADFNTFLERWSFEEIPACSFGMLFLKCVYDGVGETIFWDNWKRYEREEPLDVGVSENPCWQSFRDHYDACEDCNEV